MIQFKSQPGRAAKKAIRRPLAGTSTSDLWPYRFQIQQSKHSVLLTGGTVCMSAKYCILFY